MQMKIKGNWNWKTTKNFSMHPVAIVYIFFFFLVGVFASSIFFNSQLPIAYDLHNDDEYDVRTKRARLLESTREKRKYNLLGAGESGDDSITSIPFQVLSWRPRALYFPNFLSSQQCQTLIDMATSKGLKPSGVTFRRGYTKKRTKRIRTSYGAFIRASDDKTGTLDFIEEKIARASKLPRTHFEAFNVLRYQIGQKYDAHFDSSNASLYGPQISRRVATFLMYLSDVQEGGHTAFPFENGMNMGGRYHSSECVGLKVKPRKGDGILFYSSFPNGTLDQTALHMSCPVIKGEKWTATKWIRDQDLTWLQ